MADGSKTGKGGHSRYQCHYMEHMVAVPLEDGAQARTALGDLGVEFSDWSDDELLEILEGLDTEDVTSLRERLDLLKVENPHEAAQQIRAHGGVHASAIHGLGHMGHARAMAGEGPDPSSQTVKGQPVDDAAPVIAVVDTGIVSDRALKGLDWMSSPSVEAEARDHESPDVAYSPAASHGTFVVSLIRQNAPDRAVWLSAAKPRRLPTDRQPHDDVEPYPTTELDVVAALARLRRRLVESGRDLAGLNLSLGAHSDRPDEDDFLLSVKLSLETWLENFPGSPIFAAGGNSTDPNPVYPAAFDNVVGVGALDENGDEVVWATPGPAGRRDGSGRKWIDATAQGVGCIGLSGNRDAPVIRWGGSSFATALATATST